MRHLLRKRAALPLYGVTYQPSQPSNGYIGNGYNGEMERAQASLTDASLRPVAAER